MSYKERFKKASFRGVPFLVRNQEKSFGRRVAIHEYPFRDEIYAEDLGIKPDTFNIQAYVIGDDYDQMRDLLEQALAQPGGGELVHPSYGTMSVVPTNISTSEEYVNGKGQARFSISFTRLGEIVYPDVDQKALLDLTTPIAANKAHFLSGFPQIFSGDVMTRVENIVNEVTVSMRTVARRIRAPAESLARVEGMIDDVEENIEYLISSPEELVSAAEDIYAEIAAVSEETEDQQYQSRETYNALYVNKDFEDQFEEFIPVSDSDKQVKAAEDALVSLNVNLSAIYLCQIALTIPYISSDEGMNKINITNEWFFEIENVNNTELFDALQILRVQTTKAIAQLTEDLSASTSTSIHQMTPSLVIAHETGSDELIFVKMNNIRDPLFVSGVVKYVKKN